MHVLLDKFNVLVAQLCLAVVGFFGYSFLGAEDYVRFLVFAVVVDIVTGVVSGAINGRLSSKSFFGDVSKGLVRKLLMLLLLCLVAYGSILSNLIWVRDASIVFYVGGECLSILENLDKCGVPFPKFLRDLFENMRDRGNDGSNTSK